MRESVKFSAEVPRAEIFPRGQALLLCCQVLKQADWIQCSE